MTTTDAARRWAETWKAGWEALDAEPIVALYDPHALLSTEPFREPYVGRHGVRDYVTRVFAEEQDPEVDIGDPIVDGDRAAVSWWTSLREEGADTTLAGTSVLRFNADGLVVEQWDAWNAAAERRGPPSDWGPFKRLRTPPSEGQRRTGPDAMTVVSSLVRPDNGDGSVTMRAPGPGDLGWVVQRHGEIYFDEFGWDTTFEGLVASIVADYSAGHRPGRDNAWIAEVGGARAGCVFCRERDPATAQLRLLLVEPWARGLGVGTRLVDECIAFARAAGYRTLMLWTNDVLVAARRIYEAAGFELVEAEAHHSFGHDLVGQNWELRLDRT